MIENSLGISPEKFVDRLLEEGSKVRCDDTNEEFDRDNKVPPYYNEELYRKGQKFFYKHVFSMFVCKFHGLVAVLAIPSILKILISTGMSSSNFTAYKRYIATVFYTKIWYDDDFKPGSRSWKAITAVRNMHNSASKKCTHINVGSITQKDMALTQFGFMGFVLVKGSLVGIHNPTDEELEGFVHLWRVVGYLLGIEDRFNLCSGTVEETKQICNLLIQRVYRPEVSKKDKNFLTMSRYLCYGMSLMDPLLMYEPVMCALNVMVQDNSEKAKDEEPKYMKLNWIHSLGINIALFLFWSLRFSIVRTILNYSKLLQIWSMKKFPIAAYWKFGFKDTFVDIRI